MSLQVDYRKIQECLEDSLNRLECLRECHLLEHPLEPLPDFLFPLQKTLQDSLLEVNQVLRQSQTLPSQEALAAVRVAAQRALVEAEALVEVLEPSQVQDLGWLAQGRLTDL